MVLWCRRRLCLARTDDLSCVFDPSTFVVVASVFGLGPLSGMTRGIIIRWVGRPGALGLFLVGGLALPRPVSYTLVLRMIVL